VTSLDLEKMLDQLRRERDLIDQVILHIENLERQVKGRRGRPPGSITKNKRDATGKAPSEE
jgi:hypothetical protein